ncbi:MAG: Crp/Fnr family transcriptional regulator [Bacteroidetes bacterium]|nr:Crp/Fnr family transcriptional regulator [Bacteroidota bacterium]
MEYRKGQYIYYQGSPIFGIFIVASGKVKIISTGTGKKDQIMRIAVDGHVLGRWGTDDEVYATSGIALEDSVICFVHNDLLRNACLINTQLSFELMRFYALELKKAQYRIKILSQYSVKEKVAETLLYLSEVFGTEYYNQIPSCINQHDIASFAGTAPEQVSRNLSWLRREDIIRNEERKITIVNRPRLLELAHI